MKKLKYSLKWAESVVKKLSQAHERAFNFLMLNCEFTYGEAVIMLASGSKEFYVLREMLRYMDKNVYSLHKGGEEPLDPETTIRLLSLFKARIRQFSFRGASKALTDSQLALNLEETVFNVASVGAAPPTEDHPLAWNPSRAIEEKLSIDV